MTRPNISFSGIQGRDVTGPRNAPVSFDGVRTSPASYVAENHCARRHNQLPIKINGAQ